MKGLGFFAGALLIITNSNKNNAEGEMFNENVQSEVLYLCCFLKNITKKKLNSNKMKNSERPK